MKNRFILCVLLSSCLYFFSCTGRKSTILLSNLTPTELTDKAIQVKREKLPDIPTGSVYPIILTEKGDTIPSQLDDLDGDGNWDELFFITNLTGQEKITLSLYWSEKEPHYTIRTSVRFGKRSTKDTPVYPKTNDTLYADKIYTRLGYQPYQTDGPSWENDKVGFRHYFDGRHSKDLFGKKVPYMSPDSVGISKAGAPVDNYHVMADWGRDILSVGNSGGLGGITLLIGDSLPRIGCMAGDTLTNVESSLFKIVREGPVRSILNFNHINWKPFDRSYQVKETVGIWPGMYAYQNTVSLSGLNGDESLVVGLVNSNTPNPLKEINIDDKHIVLLTHDQQGYEREWWIGLALILPKDIYLGYGEAPKKGKFSNTFYGKLKIENNKPVTYYAVGCWEFSDAGFKDPVYFEKYVTNLARQLAAEVSVEIQ